jgi:hypothetical protein
MSCGGESFGSVRVVQLLRDVGAAVSPFNMLLISRAGFAAVF